MVQISAQCLGACAWSIIDCAICGVRPVDDDGSPPRCGIGLTTLYGAAEFRDSRADERRLARTTRSSSIDGSPPVVASTAGDAVGVSTGVCGRARATASAGGGAAGSPSRGRRLRVRLRVGEGAARRLGAERLLQLRDRDRADAARPLSNRRPARSPAASRAVQRFPATSTITSLRSSDELGGTSITALKSLRPSPYAPVSGWRRSVEVGDASLHALRGLEGTALVARGGAQGHGRRDFGFAAFEHCWSWFSVGCGWAVWSRARAQRRVSGACAAVRAPSPRSASATPPRAFSVQSCACRNSLCDAAPRRPPRGRRGRHRRRRARRADRRAQLRGDDEELERQGANLRGRAGAPAGIAHLEGVRRDDDVGDNSQLKNLKELALCSAGLAARQATYQDANTHSLALATVVPNVKKLLALGVPLHA